MEFRLSEYKTPEAITFNYDEIKEWVQNGLVKYKAYELQTIDENTVKEAKADRAKLNKLKKALNDERLKQQKEYMKPFNDFKTQVDDLIRIIDKPVQTIDKAVKSYENGIKEAKRAQLEGIFRELTQEAECDLNMKLVWNEKWLNASYDIKTAESEMKDSIEKYMHDIRILESLRDIAFEAVPIYKTTLDMEHAVSEGKRRMEYQKKEDVLPFAEEIRTKLFKVTVTKTQLNRLNDFLISENIDFEAVDCFS